MEFLSHYGKFLINKRKGQFILECNQLTDKGYTYVYFYNILKKLSNTPLKPF